MKIDHPQQQNYLSVAEQINILFETVKKSDGNTYTLSEVSEGTGLSIGALSHIRLDRIKNPQIDTLRAIALFFKVPLRYFETRSAEECYAIIAEGRSNATQTLNEIAFRAGELSEAAQLQVLAMMRWIQEAEQTGGANSTSQDPSEDTDLRA